jgi:dihydropyrimidinase
LPRVTLTGGKVAWHEGDLRAEAGQGQYVAREPFPAIHVANAAWQTLSAPRRIDRVDVSP